MNLAGWAVSCGQRNKPEMQGDGRKVKLGGNRAAEAVKMQKCCLMVGSTFSWRIQLPLHVQKVENAPMSRWESVSPLVMPMQSTGSAGTKPSEGLRYGRGFRVSSTACLDASLKEGDGYLRSEACCQPWKWLKVLSAYQHFSPLPPK